MVTAGAVELEVTDVTDFQVGCTVLIAFAEVRVVVAVGSGSGGRRLLAGSIHVDRPLDDGYPLGTAVKVTAHAAEVTTAPTTAVPTALPTSSPTLSPTALADCSLHANCVALQFPAGASCCPTLDGITFMPCCSVVPTEGSGGDGDGPGADGDGNGDGDGDGDGEATVSGNTSVIIVSLFIATVVICVFVFTLYWNKKKGNSLLQMQEMKKELETARRESVRLKKEMADAKQEVEWHRSQRRTRQRSGPDEDADDLDEYEKKLNEDVAQFVEQEQEKKDVRPTKQKRQTKIKRKKTFRKAAADVTPEYTTRDPGTGERIRIVKKSNLRGKALFKESAKRLINASRLASVATLKPAQGPTQGSQITSVRDQILASGVLDTVAVFKEAGLKEAQKKNMAQWMVVENFRAGATICAEGDDGHKFYLISSGTVNVSVGGEVVSTMGKNQTFGEVALMQDHCKRTATVTAKDDVVLLSLSRGDFHGILASGTGRRASRTMDHAAEDFLRQDRLRQSQARGRGKRRASIVDDAAMPHIGHRCKRHAVSKEKSMHRISNAMAMGMAAHLIHNAEHAKSEVKKRKRKKSIKQEQKLHNAFQTLDADHSGHVDFEEFVEICQSEDRISVLKLFELIDEDHGGTIEEEELVHCMKTNKEARVLAANFPALQSLVGLSREERRERARARRRSTKKKMKSGLSRRRRHSKKKVSSRRPSLNRKRSGSITLAALDDLAKASAAQEEGSRMLQRKNTMQRGDDAEAAVNAATVEASDSALFI